MADQRQQDAKRDAESAEVYAPPADEKALPSNPFPARAPHSPGLVGFVTLLVTTALSSLIAAGFMGYWYSITPIKPRFILAGLEETIFAFLGCAALSMFALLSGILFAVGILGRDGKASPVAWVGTAFLAVLTGVVCFIPAPKSTYVIRGFLGLFSVAISFGLNIALLRAARRAYIDPPPPPP